MSEVLDLLKEGNGKIMAKNSEFGVWFLTEPPAGATLHVASDYQKKFMGDWGASGSILYDWTYKMKSGKEAIYYDNENFHISYLFWDFYPTKK